jgi:hypothetical protein
LAINAKGGESISPKQKDRTTTPISKIFETILSFKCCFQLVLYLWYFKNWYLWNYFSSKKFYLNWYLKYLIFFQFEKTLLNTKRRISFRGSFVEVKGKAFEIGEKISNLKMLLKILFIYLRLFAKRLWKRISKNICKNKTSGASMVQNVKMKKANHAYLMKM